MKTLIKIMLLKKLIKNIPEEKKNIIIKGLAVNSKQVKKNFIFFAIQGTKLDGEKYIKDAVKKGAKVIICSKKCKYTNEEIVILKKTNVRYFLSQISSIFYNLKPKNIIAITGTNGKTSVADFFYQILSINKIPVASIGTLGIKYKNRTIKSDLTSPNTILLHRSLEKIKRDGIENVILEASSHGLHQKRMHHISPKIGIFTNLSQDHLDYHKNMKSYLHAKMILFQKILPKKSIVISDKSIKEYKILKNISKKRNLRLIDISNIEKKLLKISNLKFNNLKLKNLSMAISAAKICNLNENKIYRSLHKIKDVNGRLELVKTFSNNIKVFVDFAHTPDALQKTLISLIKSYGDNISLVFGCGGERDFKKRPIMAKIASDLCKKIYVTDDNPRNERPEKIRREIVKKIKSLNCFNIGKRSDAIRTAILNADPNEVILIAGKGHETEQIYKNKVISISDKQIVKKLKLKPKKLLHQQQNFLLNKKILKKIIKIKKVKNFEGISIDTRSIKKNNLFLTMKGKKKKMARYLLLKHQKKVHHI